MSSFTGCDTTIFFCKIGKMVLIVFQKLATSVMLKNITDEMNLYVEMNFYISGCWKAYFIII